MARTERVNATVDSNTKKELEKLSAKTELSQSEIINIALQEHLKLMSTKDNIDFITNEIYRAVESKLDKYHNRLFRLLAKIAKSSFSGLYINAHLLSYMCQNEISQEFLKQEIELANKKAYKVLKDGYLEEDIMKLFPKDFDFNKDY
ncbi:MAG: ribbon-helix-helix domain-containing protein [Clostridia bacterium]|nr:ribbon-helix-helix domain-containing protein [Clostridia bacterium]